MAKVKNNTYHKQLPLIATQHINGLPVFQHSEDRGFVGADQVYLGDSPSGWRERILAGFDATSELIGDKWSWGGSPFTYSHVGLKGPVAGHLWQSHGYQVPLAGFITDPGLAAQDRAQNQASGAILNAYLDATKQFGALDFAAEISETIGMFTNPIKGLFGASVGLAKKVGSIKKYARDASVYAQKLGSIYLGWKFGIEPLAHDLVNAAIAADMLLNQKERQFVVDIRGNGRSAEKISLGFDTLTDAYAPYAVQDVWATSLCEVRYKGKVGVGLNFPSDWAALCGFTPPNVIPAVWEGVPFSFLIDYFTNVNQVLSRSSLSNATPGLRYVTRGVKNTMEIAGGGYRFRGDHPDVIDGFIRGECGGGSFFTRRVRVHRSSGAELPPVTLNFEVPGPGQITNVEALIAAVHRSKP
jgi:hypothetical protein